MAMTGQNPTVEIDGKKVAVTFPDGQIMRFEDEANIISQDTNYNAQTGQVSRSTRISVPSTRVFGPTPGKHYEEYEFEETLPPLRLGMPEDPPIMTPLLQGEIEATASGIRQRAENEFFGMPVSEENSIRGRSPLESAAASLQGMDMGEFREAMARASRSMASFGDIPRSVFGLPPIEEVDRALREAAVVDNNAIENEARQPAAPKEKPPSPLGTQERTITIE